MTYNTYQTIAPFYNWIMEHVDYPGWAEYLENILSTYHRTPGKILEIGAGTCPFASQNLFKRADSWTFSDISYDMLQQTPGADKLRKVVCDGIELPFKEYFDGCLMIYDSFNHITDPDDALKCLKEIYRTVVPGGFFIFDVTTEFNSKEYFSDAIDFDEIENLSVVRESWYDESSRLQNNMFTYFIKEKHGMFRRLQESHLQKIYLENELANLIQASGFKLKASYHDMTLGTPSEETERIHYFLEK